MSVAVPFAPVLSASATAASTEALLWAELKLRHIGGRRFRHKHGVGPFTVDFFCPSERIAVEVERNDRMDEQAVQDLRRHAYLLRQGIRLLRFNERNIMDDMEGVLRDIHEAFAPRT